MGIQMIDQDEDRIELCTARENIKNDFRKGVISKAQYAREMQSCNDHEAHIEAMDCAFADDY